MRCTCDTLPDYAYYRPRRSLSRHLRPLVRRVERRGDRELCQCDECGKYWRIDLPSQATERFAWRLPEYRADWDLVSFEEKEKAMLLASRGEATSEACIWAHCDKPRLPGVVYCVDHLYGMGVRS
jgi:hypothetical protein